MNSRSILFGGAFCLACTLVLGSAAIQLAAGDVHLPEPVDDAASRSNDHRRAANPSRSTSPFSEGPSAARELEALLRHSEALMETSPSSAGTHDDSVGVPLSDDVLSLFVEMVQIIDESPGHRFEIVVADSNRQAAHDRAEVYRSSLLLALRHPSRLRIMESLSNRPQLTVRAIEKPRMP